MNGDLAALAEDIQRRFNETWTMDVRDLARPPADVVLRELVRAGPIQTVARLEAEFFGLGPLEPLASDPAVSEIVVNGEREVWFERGGEFSRHPDHFLTPATFKNFIDRVSAEASAAIDLARPFADGRWRDFRIHLGCAPLTDRAFHLTLRRLPSNPWTLERLAQAAWASPEQMKVLREQIVQRKNVVFIGATGSGKTSVLGACLKAVPETERIVIIEDTDELPKPNGASTKMLTRPHPSPALSEVSLTDLVKQSLRMRPFRIVMGEVRGAEAKDLLLALATGHSGSLGTLHASDPRQALLRLEMLVQLGAPQWGQQAVRQLLQLSVDSLVVCGKKNGHRQCEGIFKVAALESFGFLIEQLA